MKTLRPQNLKVEKFNLKDHVDDYHFFIIIVSLFIIANVLSLITSES